MDNFDSSDDDGTSTALADGNAMTNAMLAENTKRKMFGYLLPESNPC